jgi:tetratricopeptide (TPR) repeat protein
MKTREWILLGLLATSLGVIALWIGFRDAPQDRTDIGTLESEEIELHFERENIDAMGLSQLKVYIEECEKARDFYECERAYKRAIQRTQDQKPLLEEFINFKFGLAGLYVNSLWEYGQFGETEKIPPALTSAMHIYDEIIAAFPASELAAEAQFRRGEVFHNEFSGYWNRLHREDAVREFQKVVEFYPGTDQARKAKERLAALQMEKVE